LKFLNSPYPPDALIQLGKIVGAHGIHGAVKILSYAESTDSYTARDSIIVQNAAGEQTSYHLLDCRPHKKILRVTLDQVTTRDQAEALVGSGVYVPRDSLPPLEEDAYYWRDLIGITVLTVQGEDLGRIEQIIPTGANDVYVVRSRATPDHPKEILIPAVSSVIIEIDTDRNRMIVDLPDGLA
jgi:16S rRNA processing protein RimM